MLNKFKLNKNLVDSYEELNDKIFDDNALGLVTYLRTYSRVKKDGKKERWIDTITRVVEGTANMARRHDVFFGDEFKLFNEMFCHMSTMKFLPPGRGLWAMGTPITEKRKLYAALNNCAFVSTKNIDKGGFKEFSYPFLFMMDASMLGIGVGFDTLKKYNVVLKKPINKPKVFKVPDSREGWVKAFKILLDSYYYGGRVISFDYSKIRKEGKPLKIFGGISSGYKPLELMIKRIVKILDSVCEYNEFTSTTMVDIMNIIGDMVVSGGVRRTAQIAFGDPEDDEFIDLKNVEKNSYRTPWMGRSNNTIIIDNSSDNTSLYDKLALSIQENGEPGVFWLKNARKGRLNPFNLINYKNKDLMVSGSNPCMEQTLEDGEICCLVEVFLNKFNLDHSKCIDSISNCLLCQFRELSYLKNKNLLHKYNEVEIASVIRSALLYAKIVTLGKTTWEKTNKIIKRNRRIGLSLSSIASLEEFFKTMNVNTDEFYDVLYDVVIQMEKELIELDLNGVIGSSIKLTSVKPSGTISLLTKSTPGIHYPISRYYIRRMRINRRDLGAQILDNLPSTTIPFRVEPELVLENGEWVPSIDKDVLEFYIDSGFDVPDQTIRQQFELAAKLQRHWADNQVSCSIYFSQNEKEQIPILLKEFSTKLKGISLFPRYDMTSYRQIPYEKITREQYIENINSLKSFWKKRDDSAVDSLPELFCTNDNCLIL